MALIQSYAIENDAEFKRQIELAVSKVSDLRFAFKEIQRDWFKSNKAQFSLRGSGQYPALSPQYAEQKRKRYGNKPILVASGRLMKSITGAPNADSIVRIGKISMILGTRVPHGIFHQSDEPRFKIPLRKFFFIGPEAPASAPSQITGRLERFLTILENEVQRQLDK